MDNYTFIPSHISESKWEFISDNCDSVKDYNSEDFTIGYQLSGKCRIIYSDKSIDVAEHSLFLIEKGCFKVDAKVGSSGSFEQVLFSLKTEALFGNASRDESRREKRFEHAVLTGIISSLTIEDLAEHCCTSLSTFKRRFNERFAHSPHRWFVRCRLDIAERVAGISSIAVADLAEMCGFSNTSHFINAFRNRFGATPSRHARIRHSRRQQRL